MDTHAVIGKLQEEYGMAPRTAEAIVYAVQQGQENIKGLATKEDLAHVKDYLEGKIDRLDERMNHFEERMDRLEGRMDRLEGRMDRLAETVSNLSKEFADLKVDFADLKASFANFKVSNAKWMIGLFIALASLNVASIVFVISVLA